MHQLRESSSGGYGVALILAVIFTCVAVFVPVVSGFDFGAIAFSAFFFLFTLILWGIVILGVIKRMYYGAPDIAISKTQVGIGEEFAMSYRHEFKRNIPVKQYIFRLIMRESATYQRGTDTVTVTHDHKIDEFGYPPQTFPRGHIIQDEWKVKIPPNGMHTFSARRNKIQWFVQVEIDGPGMLDIKREYEVIVSPQVVQ
ncbi:MAG: hypothetical protein L0154_11640 [Chloroflexi bacterium]|nr:hypothetical protein [Chloroflexota bacterium]